MVLKLTIHERDLQFSYRLYLSAFGKRVIGKGGAQILEAIDQYGSITVAAQELGMSYRFVWNYLRRIRRIIGEPVISTHRGGTGLRKRRGGGGTVLTSTGKNLLKEYKATESLILRTLRSNKKRLLVRRNAAIHRRSKGVKLKT